MSDESLWFSLPAVAGVLLASAVAGWILAGAFVPRGMGWTLEKAGWSIALAVSWLALNVCFSFAVKLRPGWISFFACTAGAVAVARRFRLPHSDRPVRNEPRPAPISLLLLGVTGAGLVIYLVRSLTEPMWSNDFLAIWGLKGKTMFGVVAVPESLFRWPEFEFSHPEYPVGLPLVYAGIAFLLGRWDDHAMALLFPFLQVGTLLVLAGWLRRRGVAMPVAIAASALVANLGLLYSAWLTGMAEVPVSFAFLLVGIAFCDVLDRTDPGALRRLALAALLAAGTKNEGVFLLAAALALLVLGFIRRRERPLRAAAAAIVIPGLGSFLLHRLVLGAHPMRDFDFGLLWRPGLAGRLAESVREEIAQLLLPTWPALAGLAILVVLARHVPSGNRILLLASALLAAYLVLPAFCTLGPGWLVHWSLGRICGALAPLAAAGIGVGWGTSAPQRALTACSAD